MCFTCKAELSAQDLHFLLTEEEIERFYQHSLNQALAKLGDVSWCPTPNCQYAFIFQAGQDSNNFNCPTCKKRYCLGCRDDYHPGNTCQENRAMKNPDAADQMFQDFLKGSKYKQCPSCKVWVERSEGCNHMKCRCGMEFCYSCGSVYKQCDCGLFGGNWRDAQLSPYRRRAQEIR